MKTTNTCRVERLDSMGDDLSVVDAARVSFARQSAWADGDHTLVERDLRLIGYLARNRHWTPFSQVTVKLRIAAPVFVARQWMRSNVGVSRNEVSRRYVDDAPEFFVPDAIRARPESSVKQGSGGEHHDCRYWRGKMLEMCEHALSVYDTMIRDGVAPEQARMILPLAHMTEWIETGSLAYYARVCGLRADGHAQAEIRDLAALVAAAVEPVAPVSWRALMEGAHD